MLYLEDRTEYVILCEVTAQSFCDSLEIYLDTLEMSVLSKAVTDDPASQLAAISSLITDQDKTAILLFHHDVSKINAFMGDSTTQSIKSVVKIVSFGVIDEFTTTATGMNGIYEGTYSVNGFFESLSDSLSISINSDVFFISYIYILLFII